MGDVLLSDRQVERVAMDGYSGSPDELISLLQAHQKKHGYLSPEGVHEIAHFVRLSETHVYSVASFYTQFRFSPPGEHTGRAYPSHGTSGYYALMPTPATTAVPSFSWPSVMRGVAFCPGCWCCQMAEQRCEQKNFWPTPSSFLAQLRQ